MTEPNFKPKKGQVDFTNIRYCPVINCVLSYKDKILLVQRSKKVRLYPGYWNGLSGFIDDDKDIEAKVFEEIDHEAGYKPKDVESMKRGSILLQEANDYKKTWIVFPYLVKVGTDKVKLDWEASAHKWVSLADAKKFKLLPGFKEVLDELFGKQP